MFDAVRFKGFHDCSVGNPLHRSLFSLQYFAACYCVGYMYDVNKFVSMIIIHHDKCGTNSFLLYPNIVVLKSSKHMFVR